MALLEIGPATALEERAVRHFESMLQDDLNVKRVVVHPPGTPSPAPVEIKANFKSLGKRAGKAMNGLAKLIATDGASLRAKLPVTVTVDGVEFELTSEDFLDGQDARGQERRRGPLLLGGLRHDDYPRARDRGPHARSHPTDPGRAASPSKTGSARVVWRWRHGERDLQDLGQAFGRGGPATAFREVGTMTGGTAVIVGTETVGIKLAKAWEA